LDYAAVLAAAQREAYCDVGHYKCPCLRPDGALVFPSGIVRQDGTFEGAARLYELLCAPAAPPESEDGECYHYPRGTPCGISTLPER
jgi:hypothetical protein